MEDKNKDDVCSHDYIMMTLWKNDEPPYLKCTECKEIIQSCFWGDKPFEELKSLCIKSDVQYNAAYNRTNPNVQINGIDYTVFEHSHEWKGNGVDTLHIKFQRCFYATSLPPQSLLKKEAFLEKKRKEYTDVLTLAPTPSKKARIFYDQIRNHINDTLKEHPRCQCSNWDFSLDMDCLNTPCFMSGVAVNCKECGIMHPLVVKEFLYKICMEFEFRVTPVDPPFTHEELREVVNRVYEPGHREKAFESLKITLEDEETLEVFKQLYNRRPL